MSSAALNIELGGATQGSQYDAIHVTGQLSLAGMLAVSLINNFSPIAGTQFDILDWGSRVGAFQTLQLPGGGLTWDTSQLNVIGVLTVGGLLGDYNHNGIVDAADYTVWRDALGQIGVGLAADGNDNHVIDAGDYSVWVANFGHTIGGGGSNASANAAVPEPESWLLMCIAAIGVLLCEPRFNPANPGLLSRAGTYSSVT